MKNLFHLLYQVNLNQNIIFLNLWEQLQAGVYKDSSGQTKEVIKTKGFKGKLTFKDLEKLLIKGESLNILQEKWYKSIDDSNININEQSYNLIATENKRQLVYEKGLFVKTKPFIIDDNKTISNQELNLF